MEDRRLPKLDLNVTNRCNYRCTHCAFDSGVVEMDELLFGELEKLLRETKEIGGERFDITGGEPLLRKDIDKLISIGKDLDYKIELVTNGSLLNQERLLRFKELGLDGIAISLDGSNAEIYNHIRRMNEKTFDGVVEVIGAAKEIGFYAKVNSVVFESNLEDMPNITELALRLGADEHGIYYFTPVGRGKRSCELAVEPLKWLNFIRERFGKYRDCGMRISIELPLIERENCKGLECVANLEKSHLQVLPDGNVYPCAIAASYGKPVANIRECSIKDIWRNEELWRNYWSDLSNVFVGFGRCCVDFGGAFDVGKYDFGEYLCVCPMRKFDLDDERITSGMRGA